MHDVKNSMFYCSNSTDTVYDRYIDLYWSKWKMWIFWENTGRCLTVLLSIFRRGCWECQNFHFDRQRISDRSAKDRLLAWQCFFSFTTHRLTCLYMRHACLKKLQPLFFRGPRNQSTIKHNSKNTYVYFNSLFSLRINSLRYSILDTFKDWKQMYVAPAKF